MEFGTLKIGNGNLENNALASHAQTWKKKNNVVVHGIGISGKFQ